MQLGKSFSLLLLTNSLVQFNVQKINLLLFDARENDLKGQSNEIFDLQFFSSFKTAWAMLTNGECILDSNYLLFEGSVWERVKYSSTRIWDVFQTVINLLLKAPLKEVSNLVWFCRDIRFFPNLCAESIIQIFGESSMQYDTARNQFKETVSREKLLN